MLSVLLFSRETKSPNTKKLLCTAKSCIGAGCQQDHPDTLQWHLQAGSFKLPSLGPTPHCGAAPQPAFARAALPVPRRLRSRASPPTLPSSRSARPWPWKRVRASEGGRAEGGGGGAGPCRLQSIGCLPVVPAPRRSRRLGGPRQAAGVGLSLWQKEGKLCGWQAAGCGPLPPAQRPPDRTRRWPDSACWEGG